MRVGIVGAGIAGIAAGRRLHQSGVSVTLFEKSRGVGGRVATRRKDGFTWDIGATSVAMRGRSLDKVILDELSRDDLFVVTKPIFVHDDLHPQPGDGRTPVPRYAYRTGMTKLAKLLAEDLDIRFESPVERIERHHDRYTIHGEEFDRLVLTAPIPQTGLLLWAMDLRRAIAQVRYRTCLSVGLGFTAPLPETSYHALLDPSLRHPLSWLCLESVKVPDHAPAGSSSIMAQLGREFSRLNYETPDDELVRIVCGYLTRLYGPAFAHPSASTVMRWKYAQPESLIDFDTANPEGTTVLIAGDALSGARIEEAYETGLMAAERILS